MVFSEGDAALAHGFGSWLVLIDCFSALLKTVIDLR